MSAEVCTSPGTTGVQLLTIGEEKNWRERLLRRVEDAVFLLERQNKLRLRTRGTQVARRDDKPGGWRQ